jgi:hypothetical protein
MFARRQKELASENFCLRCVFGAPAPSTHLGPANRALSSTGTFDYTCMCVSLSLYIHVYVIIYEERWPETAPPSTRRRTTALFQVGCATTCSEGNAHPTCWREKLELALYIYSSGGLDSMWYTNYMRCRYVACLKSDNSNWHVYTNCTFGCGHLKPCIKKMGPRPRTLAR